MRGIIWLIHKGRDIRRIWLKELLARLRTHLLSLNLTSAKSISARLLKLEGLVIE
jgi:hypothetical protein